MHDLRAAPEGRSAFVLLDPPAGASRVRDLVRITSTAENVVRGELPTTDPADAFVGLATDAEGAVLGASIVTAVFGYWGAASATAAPSTFTHDAAAHVDNAPARLASSDPVAPGARGSPAGAGATSWARSVFVLRDVVAAETAGEATGVAARPAGVPDSLAAEAANSGKATMRRAPGSSGNAGTVRIMEPTAQYLEGYVRVYNDSGQPVSG